MAAAAELSWFFELVDGVSNPASDIAKKLGVVERALIVGAGASLKMQQAQEKLGHTAKQTGEDHGGFLHKLHDIVEVAYEGGIMLRELGEKIREVASEALNEMAFKQNSVIALKSMLGTRDAAIEVFEGVERFAWQTGQNITSVMQTTKDLLSTGFDLETVENIRLMLSDMAVVDPGKSAAIGAIIGEIGRRGELTARQMRTLSDNGADATLMWAELSKQTGISVPALKSMEGVTFKAGTAVTALMSVLSKKYSGGVLGSLSAEVGDTLPALIKKVGHLPELIIDELVGFTNQGDSAIGSILKNIISVFDPGSESGQRVIATIRDLGDAMFAGFGFSGKGGLLAKLAGPEGPAAIEQLFKDMAKWVKDGIPAWRDFAGAVKDIASGLVTVVGLLNGSGGDKLYKFLHPFEGDAAGRLAYDVDQFNSPKTDAAIKYLRIEDIEREAAAGGKTVVYIDMKGAHVTKEVAKKLVGALQEVHVQLGAAGAR